FGSTIDTRAGGVTLTAALPKGATQTGRFSDGEFVLTQASDGTVTLTLAGGSFTPCPAPGASSASAPRALPTAVIRELSGEAHGKFVTKGRYASASVSSSAWMTADRCDGTYAAVTTGSAIVVANASPHVKHDVKQGHGILVRGPG
ncbi:MAG TPA: hypothetical protein VKS25_14380, partial [Solirubrobacteraceae bacterium]|nr:hypothetical protein [Solirubrobacteraceae bacterium]